MLTDRADTATIAQAIAAEAEGRGTPTTAEQLREATQLAEEWLAVAEQHRIDAELLDWVTSIYAAALDAVKVRDRREVS